MLFGCSFINVLLELGAGHPAGQASIRYLDNIRTMLRERAEGAGLVDVDDFARSWWRGRTLAALPERGLSMAVRGYAAHTPARHRRPPT